ncbi:putative nuclease HARBI1 [Prorops nasuta]|uniref:putative nuclease HARBI1 n=1 Tax=Prorops nasuta TaxID=863751 RepID=UPI0034CDFEDA
MQNELPSTLVAPIIAAVSVISFNFYHESDSSSESEDDDNITLQEKKIIFSIMKNNIRENKIIEKLNGYVKRVIPKYTRDIFKEHFRVYPITFQMILTLIGPALSVTPVKFGKKPIDAKKQLYIALWFMATPDSYRSVCVKFGVGKATAFRAVRRVTYALHCIAPKFIKWPSEHASIVIEGFKNISSIPNVIGAIDGTHIKIKAPTNDAISYINRKGFASLNLQVVCDSTGLFTHCYAGQPGSVHDARVFRNSPVANFLNMPEIFFPNGCHIIGDAAYPIHPHMMVPFRDKGHLTHKQTNYNYCLSSTRIVVERGIGQLKIRFRILLDCLPLTDLGRIPEFIIACCVLHNICILQNDVFPVSDECNEELSSILCNNNIHNNNSQIVSLHYVK